MEDIFTSENINTIINIIIIPLLAYLTKYVVSCLKAKKDAVSNSDKTDNEKYLLLRVYDIVVQCIECTNQTYADALREQGKFDIEAQKIALQKTTSAVLEILSDEMTSELNKLVGNVEVYLNTLIESIIKQNKQNKQIEQNKVQESN